MAPGDARCLPPGGGIRAHRALDSERRQAGCRGIRKHGPGSDSLALFFFVCEREWNGVERGGRESLRKGMVGSGRGLVEGGWNGVEPGGTGAGGAEWNG
eukprot:2486030-Rhodomonas_salina.4